MSLQKPYWVKVNDVLWTPNVIFVLVGIVVLIVAFSAIAFWIIVELGSTNLGDNDHTTNIVIAAMLGKIILWFFINI